MALFRDNLYAVSCGRDSSCHLSKPVPLLTPYGSDVKNMEITMLGFSTVLDWDSRNKMSYCVELDGKQDNKIISFSDVQIRKPYCMTKKRHLCGWN